MQLSLKTLTVAAGLALALGSTSALAVDSPTTGDSSLIVVVYDPVLGASVAQDLGLNYSNFLESMVTPDSGLSLDFSVDMSVFTTVGSNLSDLQWSVYAGDSVGNYTSTEVLATAALDAGTIPGINSDVVGMLTSGISAVAAWDQNCASAVTCTGTGFGNTYFGGFGEDFNNSMRVPAAGAIGSALGFYSLRRSSIGASGTLVSTQYANINSFAQWLLGSDGTLTYSVSAVPLPAAVWLLLSGIAGLGVVGRRKGAALPTAA